MLCVFDDAIVSILFWIWHYIIRVCHKLSMLYLKYEISTICCSCYYVKIDLSLTTVISHTLCKRSCCTIGIKKKNLGPVSLENFRLVSNPSFVSKIIEKVQPHAFKTTCLKYMSRFSLHIENTMKLKPPHSVSEEWRSSCHRQQTWCAFNRPTPLIFSAAFDTMYHGILSWLRSLRVKGAALD